MRRVKLPELWVTRRTEAYRSSDPSDKDPDSGGDVDDSGVDKGDKDTDDDGGPASDKGKDGKDSDSVPKSELDKALERMKAADKRASDAEAKLRSIEDKDKSELELAQRRVKELEEKQAELAEQVREKALHHALLTDPEFPASRWHDPADVLLRAERALKAEEITIEDDGTVKGSTTWLKGLAKKSKHLLKPEDDGPEDDDERVASGGRFNGKNKDGKKADEAALRRKYPALR